MGARGRGVREVLKRTRTGEGTFQERGPARSCERAWRRGDGTEKSGVGETPRLGSCEERHRTGEVRRAGSYFTLCKGWSVSFLAKRGTLERECCSARASDCGGASSPRGSRALDHRLGGCGAGTSLPRGGEKRSRHSRKPVTETREQPLLAWPTRDSLLSNGE